MVLTHRRSRAISRYLPDEVINEIIQNVPRSDLLTLCQLSKLFHGLAVSALYRVIKLDTFTSIKSFCRAVLSNPRLAASVRSFTARCYQRFGLGRDTDPIALVLRAVKLFFRLEHLVIAIALFKEEHRRAFLQWSFPCLVNCSMTLTTSGATAPLLSSFLLRHPALASFSSSLSNLKFDAPLPIPLSNLRGLHAPVTLVPWIMTRDLREVKLSWGSKSLGHDVEKTILALKSMIPAETPFICSNDYCEDYFTAVVDSVSRHLPHTRTLDIRRNGPMHPGDARIAYARECLARFAYLVFLSIHTTSNHASFTMAEARTMAEHFGDVCPSLEACRFSADAAWRRVNGTWEKFPSRDFAMLAGITF
ncbi:hypothetical protein DFH07DRAFT_986968 [Mycena maculata]|uniref:F-box domain-containing protein n=1 Tax=Mycena maculata TaxID=230809 RepID=A0AAD7MX75_9AGAR|nr:hypothetical protein DFH07DRAFT_986968 [Mycena maculata]